MAIEATTIHRVQLWWKASRSHAGSGKQLEIQRVKATAGSLSRPLAPMSNVAQPPLYIDTEREEKHTAGCTGASIENMLGLGGGVQETIH